MARWALTVRRDRFLATSCWCILCQPLPSISCDSSQKRSIKCAYLRNTLLVLSAEEDGPGNTTGVLALEEEGLSLAVLESEDLAITTDIELAL